MLDIPTNAANLSEVNGVHEGKDDLTASESDKEAHDTRRDFEFLNQFLLDFSESSQAASTTLSSSDNTRATEPKTVNIDQNDENIFDHKFLGMDENTMRSANAADEKNMFANIFEEYLNPMSKNHSRQKDELSRINDSFYKSHRKYDNSLNSRDLQILSKMSSRLRDELFERTKLCMLPTLEYIDSIETSTALVQYFHSIMNTWKQHAQEASGEQLESIYLNDLLSGPQTVGPSHEKWLEALQVTCEKEPLMPELNVLTLPTIFNRIIKNLAFDFRDGQLCLSLFNIVKQDLATYTIMCNQQTYNEIIKALWIYNGKSNLYHVESVFVEMGNNGFKGDVITCNILKQIVIDYHQMKSGQFPSNFDSGTRIWSKDDESRVATLEKGLHALVGRLRRISG